MALWSNTDANTSAPKGMATGFAATGAFANGYTLWANAQANIVTTNQAVGVFGVDNTEQVLSAVRGGASGHPQHAGWVLRKAGMGPILTITANTGAVATNSYITFSGGGVSNTAANARITVNSANYIVDVTINNPGKYVTTPTATATSGNAVFTLTMGGRANRVSTETLVAMGSLTSDGSDDTIYPDS